MLAEDIQERSAASLIGSLPCRVQLPEKLKESFELKGPTPTMPDENRRYPRLRCRSEGHRAGLQCVSTYDSLARTDAWAAAYVADFSKGGIQVIHHEQLYPGERVRVLLVTGNLLDVEVVRCRRLGQACYTVGAKILKVDR